MCSGLPFTVLSDTIGRISGMREIFSGEFSRAIAQMSLPVTLYFLIGFKQREFRDNLLLAMRAEYVRIPRKASPTRITASGGLHRGKWQGWEKSSFTFNKRACYPEGVDGIISLQIVGHHRKSLSGRTVLPAQPIPLTGTETAFSSVNIMLHSRRSPCHRRAVSGRFAPANRGAFSKPARFSRHRRRFAAFPLTGTEPG